MTAATKLRPDSFSIGWVLVCLLSFAGGLVLQLAVVASFTLGTENWAYAALTVGTAIGGLFASRVSRRSILKEALVAVLIMVAVVYELVLLIQLPAEDGAWMATLRVGLPSAVGAIAGTVFGWRNRRWLRSDSEWRWSGISFLLTMGWLTVIYIVMLTFLPSMRAEGSAGLNVLALLVAVLLGGAVTQAIAPMQSFAICGAGGFWAGILGVVITVSSGQLGIVGAVFGTAILSVLTIFIGALGARIGYALSGRRVGESEDEDLPSEAELPTATVKDSA